MRKYKFISARIGAVISRLSRNRYLGHVEAMEIIERMANKLSWNPEPTIRALSPPAFRSVFGFYRGRWVGICLATYDDAEKEAERDGRKFTKIGGGYGDDRYWKIEDQVEVCQENKQTIRKIKERVRGKFAKEYGSA